MSGIETQPAACDAHVDVSQAAFSIEIDRLGDWAGGWDKAAAALGAHLSPADGWLGLLVESAADVATPVRLNVGVRRVGEPYEQPEWRVLDKRAHVGDEAIFSAVYRLDAESAVQAIRAGANWSRKNILFLSSRSETHCVEVLSRVVGLRQAERSPLSRRLSSDCDELRRLLADEGLRLIRVWDGLRSNPDGGFDDREIALEIY